jgi:hypothetical protein
LFFAQAVQSQELKWHTNVKEAIAIGKRHKPLMILRVVIGVDGASDYKRSVIEFQIGSSR